MLLKMKVSDAASQQLRASRRGSKRLRHLLTSEQVMQMLERERARSDRSGLGFCLAVFGIDPQGKRKDSLPRIARAALRRARLTDEVGWLDAEHVCVLLPDTAAGGARRLTRDVAGTLARAGIKPEVRIYGYDVSLPAHQGARRRDHDDRPGVNGGSGRSSKDHAGGPRGRNGSARRPGIPVPGGLFAPADRRAGHISHDGGYAAGHGARKQATGERGDGRGSHTQAKRQRQPDALAGCALLDVQASALLDERPVEAAGADGEAMALNPSSPAAHAMLDDVEGLLIKPLPAWKRALDLIGAGVALILFSPFMLLAVLAVRLTSRGPVIFKQPRAGLGGRPFTMYKFRSMVVDAEARQASLHVLNEQDGPAFKIKDDPRVTRIGKILRKTSLDELPQLFNVLKGEMTLVGPRPLPVKESDQCHRWHRRRLDVTPGVTCVWQVAGRSEVFFDQWMRMDLAYIRRRSLWVDIKLIVLTIPAVLLRRGAR